MVGMTAAKAAGFWSPHCAEGGGLGGRAGLRRRGGKPRGGSNPPFRTTQSSLCPRGPRLLRRLEEVEAMDASTIRTAVEAVVQHLADHPDDARSRDKPARAVVGQGWASACKARVGGRS